MDASSIKIRNVVFVYEKTCLERNFFLCESVTNNSFLGLNSLDSFFFSFTVMYIYRGYSNLFSH